MAPFNFPYEQQMNIQLIDGKKRKKQTVIFTNPYTAYFFHGNKKYNVSLRSDDLSTVIVYSVTTIPGEDLPEEELEA